MVVPIHLEEMVNRSRRRRRVLALARYCVRACDVAGGAENTRMPWSWARAASPFYRGGYMPYGWMPSVPHAKHRLDVL